MAIEIRQLVVKSNLVQKAPNQEPQAQKVNLEQLRQSVLVECKEMIAEALRETRER